MVSSDFLWYNVSEIVELLSLEPHWGKDTVVNGKKTLWLRDTESQGLKHSDSTNILVSEN